VNFLSCSMSVCCEVPQEWWHTFWLSRSRGKNQ